MNYVPPLFIRSLFVLLLLLMQSAVLAHGYEHYDADHVDSCAACLVGEQPIDSHDVNHEMDFTASVEAFLSSGYQSYIQPTFYSRHSRAPPK